MAQDNTNPSARWLRVAVSLGALSAGLVTAPAFAQGTPESVANPQAASEIIVTARRREEDLSDVPIAITAIGQEDLLKRAVSGDADLQRTVPGLTIRQTQGNNSLTYSLRGQSADIFSGSPSAVVTYLNEVPIPVSESSAFFDLQAVEVLKGPQGTLFGRNATGGAVLFTSAKPTDTLEGYVRGRIGNYDRREVEGAINLPLAEDTIMLRGAFKFVYADGYIENLINGDDLGRENRENGRLTLTVKPGETVSNTTMVQYSNNHSLNTGASYTWSVYAPGETNNGYALTTSAGFLFSPALDFLTGPGSWDAYLAQHPNAYAPGLVAYVDEQRRLGPYKTNHPSGARHFGENWTMTNTTEIELGSNLTVRNIIGYVDSFVNSQQPQLGAPFTTILTENLATGAVGNSEDLRSFSEEIQLQGEAMDGALEFIIGGYLQRQRTITQFPQTYFELAPIIPFSPATNRFRIKNHVDAIYGQATYDFGQGFSLTGGLRYTWEKVFGLQLPGSDNFGPAEQSRTYSDPSWEVGIDYQATPGLMLYAKTRGSFRSGGYNGTLSPDYVAQIGASNFFDAETTEDIEAGLKYGGYAFGRPATFNIAAFVQWIHDVQRVEFPDPDGPAGPVASIAITTNVPEQRVQGIEMEASLAPADWLQIGGQLADIAIVGVPDPKTGELACAVIVPVAGSRPDVPMLAEYLSGLGVTRFKYPERVELRKSLPRNEAGKVLKHVLRAELA